MSYTTDCSDSFNRADGGLFASSLDNAAGGIHTVTWENTQGVDFSIATNKAVNTDASLGIHIALVGLTGTTGQKVTATSYGSGAGVITRFDNATGKYYLFQRESSASVFYYFDGGIHNNIASTATTIADADIIAGESQVANHTFYKNGAVLLTTSHATITSGKPGMYSSGGGAGFDNFKYETGTSGGATATNLGITTALVGNQSNVAFTTQPVVAVRDAGFSTVTTDTSTVTATLNTLTGSGTLGGTTTAVASSGVATFSNLKVTGAGSFTITFTDGSLTSAVTSTFYVGAADVHITSQATTAYTQRTHGNIVVAVRDGGGTTVGNATNSVTIALTVLSGAAVLTSGTTTQAAVAGVATFNNLLVTCTDGATWTYAVSASGLTGDTSSPLTGTVRSLDVTDTNT